VPTLTALDSDLLSHMVVYEPKQRWERYIGLQPGIHRVAAWDT